MDFVEKLPVSQKRDTVMVIVDRLSKFTYFIVLEHPYTAPKVVQYFIEEIFELYEMPNNYC